MSGFIKRGVKTVNPAGGVNPAQTPNVGQYGWTSYDAANVNQLIQYVDLSKQYAEQAKAHADYVELKYTEIVNFMFYIEHAYETIKPIVEHIDVIYADVKHLHEETLIARDQSLVASTQAINAATQAGAHATSAQNSASEAMGSQTAAKASEVASARSAQEAADIAEELRKGQVYRGTWNIEANNSYPPKPDTNSVWDITLNEDSVEFTFDGQRWFWGDRLLYLKDTDQFSQIESGSTVVSVNGKRGAVTLEAKDVGALPSHGFGMGGRQGSACLANEFTEGKTFDFNDLITAGEYTCSGNWANGIQNKAEPSGHTGIVKVEVRNFGAGPSYVQTFTFQQDEVAARTVRMGTGTHPNITWNKWKPFGQWEANLDYRLTMNRKGGNAYPYLTMNKAEPRTDLTTGYYTTGAIQFKEGPQSDENNPDTGRPILLISGGTSYNQGLNRGLLQLRKASNNNIASEVALYESNVSQIVEGKIASWNGTDLTLDKKKVYHEGFKPTAADVGAVSKSGDTMTGPLVVAPVKSAIKVDDQKSISFQDQSNTMYHMLATGNNLMINTGTNAENNQMQLGSDGTLVSQGPQYARIGHIARSPNNATRIAIEAPDAGSPYISYQAPGMSNPVVGIKFNTNEAEVSSALKVQGKLNSNRGYSVITQPDGTNAVHEWHVPGKHAALMWLEGSTGDLNISRSNGVGAETARIAKFDRNSNFVSYGGLAISTTSASWGWYGNGGIIPRVDQIKLNLGEWHPMVTSPQYLHNTAGWSMRWSIGHFRSGFGSDPNYNGDFVINMTGDGYLVNNQRFHFTSVGGLKCEGTHNNATWSVEAGGHLYGSVFGSYGNMIAWCNASFAPSSDAKLKKDIKPSTVNALEDVAKIQFKEFTWIEDDRAEALGVIAQDIEQINPDYVNSVRTFNPDGSIDTEIKTLDTAALLSLSLKAIQEQQAIISDQGRLINTLCDELTTLKEKVNEFLLK